MRLSEDQIKEIIRKIGKQKWAIYSKKKKKGRRRRLGTFNSRSAANKRERQIQYFKNVGESVKISRKQLRKIILSELKKLPSYEYYEYGIDQIPDKTKGHEEIIGHT